MLFSQVRYTFRSGARRTWTLRVSLLRSVSGTELCIKMGLITIAWGEPQQCPSYRISKRATKRCSLVSWKWYVSYKSMDSHVRKWWYEVLSYVSDTGLSFKLTFYCIIHCVYPRQQISHFTWLQTLIFPFWDISKIFLNVRRMMLLLKLLAAQFLATKPTQIPIKILNII